MNEADDTIETREARQHPDSDITLDTSEITAELERADSAHVEGPEEAGHRGEDGGGIGAEAATDDEDIDEPDASGRKPSRRRGGLLLAGVLVSALVCALFVPHVRTVLRQSFTQMPQTYTALAFTSDPTIRGAVLSVPVSVQGTNTGTDTYRVKVWTVNASGRTDASTSAEVPTVRSVTATVVTLPIAADAAVVWVSLDGTDHAIYYRIS